MSNKTITANSALSPSRSFKESVFHYLDLGNTWIARQKTRRQLAQLPAYLLRDIGLSEADRYQESRKHFWQR